MSAENEGVQSAVSIHSLFARGYLCLHKPLQLSYSVKITQLALKTTNKSIEQLDKSIYHHTGTFVVMKNLADTEVF